MRFLCCAVVILCSLLIGIETARKYKLCCDVLSDMCALCLHMHGCIRYERTEPEMIMQSFIANSSSLKQCIESILIGSSFHDAWFEINSHKEICMLAENEKTLVKEMGERLGMCDIEGELSRLERINLQLELCLQKRQSELESKKRLCLTYGLLAGVFISILII